jgi:hypothetical protein
MRRLLIVLVCLSLPLCAGCASEREYFFNHNPITDTTIVIGQMIGGFFEKANSDLTDVKYESDKAADIRYLDRH